MGESESLAQSCKGKKKSRAEVRTVTSHPGLPRTEGTLLGKRVTLEQGLPVGSRVKPRAEGLGQTQKEKESSELLPDGIFPEKKKDKATSGCRDSQLCPDAGHPRDFPPATAWRWM